jgi:hypothetical protein
MGIVRQRIEDTFTQASHKSVLWVKRQTGTSDTSACNGCSQTRGTSNVKPIKGSDARGNRNGQRKAGHSEMGRLRVDAT